MYLVDTNVVSELARARPEPKVLGWARGNPAVGLSVITVEEIAFGIARLPSARQARMTAWFEAMMGGAAQIFEVDTAVARMAGELRARRQSGGRPVAQADMLIAATALANGLTLATRNTKDFVDCGVAVVNPFE